MCRKRGPEKGTDLFTVEPAAPGRAEPVTAGSERLKAAGYKGLEPDKSGYLKQPTLGCYIL